MRLSPAFLLPFALAACSDPTPAPPKPAEPQAGSATELRDAIQAPQDKARAVEADTLEAAEAQRKQIEAQGG